MILIRADRLHPFSVFVGSVASIGYLLTEFLLKDAPPAANRWELALVGLVCAATYMTAGWRFARPHKVSLNTYLLYGLLGGVGGALGAALGDFQGLSAVAGVGAGAGLAALFALAGGWAWGIVGVTLGTIACWYAALQAQQAVIELNLLFAFLGLGFNTFLAWILQNFMRPPSTPAPQAPVVDLSQPTLAVASSPRGTSPEGAVLRQDMDKSEGTGQILEFIEAASVSEALKEQTIAYLKLPPKQREYVEALSDALLDKRIAARMKISENSLKDHRQAVWKKLMTDQPESAGFNKNKLIKRVTEIKVFLSQLPPNL